MKKNNTTPSGSHTRIVPALLLAGFLPAAAAAEIPTTELPAITVSAHAGSSIPYDCTGASVTVLEVDELRQEGIITLSEALTQVPGVHTLPGGGLAGKGNSSKAVIRGMSRDAYLLPMLDGMLVNTSNGNSVITSNLIARTNLFDLGNVEILRGAQGAIYGGGAISGILYMETPRGEGDPSLRIFHESGSHHTNTTNATAQGQQDKLHFFLSSTYEHTHNEIRTASGEKPALPKAGHYENYAQALRLDYELNEATTFTTTYRREDAAYYSTYCAGGYSAVTPYRFRSNLITARLESKVSKDYTASLHTGFYGADNMFGHGANQDMRNVQLEWRNSLRWNKQHRTMAGLRWFRSQYDCSYSETSNTLENLYSLQLEHQYSVSENWRNTLALRWDYSSIYQSQPTVRAASSYRFAQGSTRIFGSAGSGYRGPNSFERSRGSLPGWDGIYHGNPDLKCESSWSADAGVEQQLSDTITLTGTLFWAQVKDPISYTTIGTDHYYCNEQTHWTTQGIELSLEGELEDEWATAWCISYTYTRPKQSNGAPIPDSCRQVWSADIHTTPLPGFTTGMGLSAALNRRDYARSAPRLDSYYTLRWYARYEVCDWLTLHTRVENITDQKWISDSGSGNILSPGTSIHAGCTLSF